jgi:hypothetical protein
MRKKFASGMKKAVRTKKQKTITHMAKYDIRENLKKYKKSKEKEPPAPEKTQFSN